MAGLQSVKANSINFNNVKISGSANNALNNNSMTSINSGVVQNGNLDVIKLSDKYSKYEGTELENVYAVTNNGEIIGFTNEDELGIDNSNVENSSEIKTIETKTSFIAEHEKQKGLEANERMQEIKTNIENNQLKEDYEKLPLSTKEKISKIEDSNARQEAIKYEVNKYKQEKEESAKVNNVAYHEKTKGEAILNEHKQNQLTSVCDVAKSAVGNPYVFGGTSIENGIDCSGLVSAAYGSIGIVLPHSSNAIRNCGTEVPKSAIKENSLQIGDVLCYDGHVSMYIGGGKVVSAAGEKLGVITQDVQTGGLLSIRRMID